MTGKNISITAILGILIALQALGYGVVTEMSIRPLYCQTATNGEGIHRGNLSRYIKEAGATPSSIEQEAIDKARSALEFTLGQKRAYCQ